MADKPAPQSAKQIEAALAASRQRLAGTIDELAFRAQPKEIAKRGAEDLKLKASSVTQTSDGELDHQKVGTGLAGLSGVLILLGLIRRARS